MSAPKLVRAESSSMNDWRDKATPRIVSEMVPQSRETMFTDYSDPGDQDSTVQNDASSREGSEDRDQHGDLLQPPVPPTRPAMLRFHSSPSFGSSLSPTRHHFRLANATPRRIKETLDAKYKADASGQTVRINHYRLVRDAGSGAFGSVKMAIDEKTGIKYAVKEYSKARLQRILKAEAMQRRRRGEKGNGTAIGNGSSIDLVRREIAIMKKLDHPNVVCLEEVLDDPLSDKLYIIMEWCEKGEIMPSAIMNSTATPYSYEQCRLFFRDMILGLEYLHSQDVIHRDIKPENILLTEDDVVKIADFGVSEIIDKSNDVIKKTAGSPAYMAPELAKLASGRFSSLRGGDSTAVEAVSGRPADLWSMGVTLYYMLFGKLPFQSDTVAGLYNCIINDPVDLESCEDEELKDLLIRLLEKSPTKRITMAELRSHPWVTCGGEDELLSTEENTAEDITPITDEDMLTAIEHIKGYMEPDEAAARLQRLHGWRGMGMVDWSQTPSREVSPSASIRSERERDASTERKWVSKLSLALDEAIFGSTSVTVPRENNWKRPSLNDLRGSRSEDNSPPKDRDVGQTKSSTASDEVAVTASAAATVGSDDVDASETSLERRPSRTRVRDLLGLEMTSLRSRSLDSDARL
uniref:ARAD1C33946p n=1 Tax=Blastobotrys adeninivorans TaxID=409370 RepID=A0A060T3J4_BLAAD